MTDPVSNEPITDACLCEPLLPDDGQGIVDLDEGKPIGTRTGTPFDYESLLACWLPNYLFGGAESVGQDSGLLVTEGRRGLPSLHIGGPATWKTYILINIPQL